MRHNVSLAAGLVMAAAGLAAQHGYSSEDIERGRTLYASNCTGCHGADGDRVAGVALASGRFRRAETDDQAVRLIVNGIPGTSMPAHKFSDAEAGSVVAYLRTMKTAGTPVAAGDAGRGRELFAGKGKCASCHGDGGPGSRLAPSLAATAAARRPVEIERAILDPHDTLAPDFQTVRVVTNSGDEITGRLLNRDTFSVQMLDRQERLRAFDRSTLRELTLLKTSPMPSYRDVLSPQEVVDLVAYIRTLGGRK